MLQTTEKSWYAIYVKSRHEFITFGELLKKGIDAYLPTVRRLRQWKDRRKSVEFPLFPGYLFIRISPEPGEVSNVLKTRGVMSLLCSEKGSPESLPNEEIDSLKLLLESGEEFDIYPHLREGTRVKVTRGALAGASGTVVKKEVNYMFMVSIELLGRSLGVKIYAEDMAVS
jgi:transcription antitermination factor NusG